MNYALQPMTKEEFVRLVTADQPDAPPYFTYDAILNAREHTSLDSNLEQVLRPIDLDEALRMGDAGAQILEVRDAAEYAKGHLAGSINIGLGGQYATWAGTVLDRAKPIVIIAEPGREKEAALRLGRIGFDHVTGYMQGGMEALAGRSDLIWPTERVSALSVAEELASTRPPLLLDVRNPREWATKHVDGSVNVPLNQPARARRRNSARPADCDPLRGRLPLVDRRRYSPAVRDHESSRDGRRSSRLGSR